MITCYRLSYALSIPGAGWYLQARLFAGLRAELHGGPVINCAGHKPVLSLEMSKLFVLLVIAISATAGKAGAQTSALADAQGSNSFTEYQLNARGWRALSRMEKAMWVQGYREAGRSAREHMNLVKCAVIPEPMLSALTNGEVVQLVDDAAKDIANSNIPIGAVLNVVTMRSKGANLSEADIERAFSLLRARYAQ